MIQYGYMANNSSKFHLLSLSAEEQYTLATILQAHANMMVGIAMAQAKFLPDNEVADQAQVWASRISNALVFMNTINAEDKIKARVFRLENMLLVEVQKAVKQFEPNKHSREPANLSIMLDSLELLGKKLPECARHVYSEDEIMAAMKSLK